MKVATADDVALAGLLGTKDERVIGGADHLTQQHALRIQQAITRGPVYLRHAAQRVRVLHLATVFVRRHDWTATKQHAQVFRRHRLPRMRSRRMNARIESLRRPKQRLQRHRARDICERARIQRIRHRQCSHRGHTLRPVDQSQALFCLQHHRNQPGLAQTLGSRQRPYRARPAHLHFALADHRQGQMRKRC